MRSGGSETAGSDGLLSAAGEVLARIAEVTQPGWLVADHDPGWVDPHQAALAWLEDCARVEARLSAARHAVIAGMANIPDDGAPTHLTGGDASMPVDYRPTMAEVTASELAHHFVLTPATAGARVRTAQTLATLPRVMRLWAAGQLDEARAQAIGRAMGEHLPAGAGPLDSVDGALWDAVEAAVAANAPARTARQLQGDVKTALHRLAPEAAQKAHENAKAGRKVMVWAEPDGMATLQATLTAAEAVTVKTVLDLAADADPRKNVSKDQKRADVFVRIHESLLSGTPLTLMPRPVLEPEGPFGVGTFGDGEGEAEPREADSLIPEDLIAQGPLVQYAPITWDTPDLPERQRRRPHLVIHVNDTTLTGDDDLPGMLEGYGAVTARVAREIAKQAGSADLVTHATPANPTARSERAEAGDHRHDDRHQTYRPHDSLVRAVIAKHPTCRAPGCGKQSRTCDLDHVQEHQRGGKTCQCNMVPLCRWHHRLKTARYLTPELHRDGGITWRNRHHHHRHVPPPERPGQWPDTS